ncbi:type II toxin-antitoxin system death-on-curing family toxin [Saccharibacillus sacchari]|uniref:Type II toxin-antitoxin system death-on-curing family toxin n=1 Tax=Saccharibacillus sacchari TaxID=456493 RepID=A0ACC6P8I5_9BACL
MIELTTEDIQQLHDDMIAEHGGVRGTKDPGCLDFIAQQPFEVVFGQETYPDLFSKAAAYLVLIARSHMFFDANKRTEALPVTYSYYVTAGR